MWGPEDVIHFWFVEHGQPDWFGGKPEFDVEIAERFTETHAKVAMGEAWRWRTTTEGRLAEIIVLDQFSRQLFRADARAFASDTMALALAQEAVAQGLDANLPMPKLMFLYMPYMHSESLLIHEEAMRLFAPLGEDLSRFEVDHREVLRRFGRFPRRNAALGRTSTEAELAYMAGSTGMF